MCDSTCAAVCKRTSTSPLSTSPRAFPPGARHNKSTTKEFAKIVLRSMCQLIG